MINQRLAQKQRLKILPQQIQLLNFFHLNTLELELRIQNELEDNPLLEDQKNDYEPMVDRYNKDAVKDFSDWEEFIYDDIPDYKLEYNNYLHDEKFPDKPIVSCTDFRKTLKEQYKLNCDDENEIEIANYLIDSLSDCGLMDLSAEDLAEDFSFKNNKWLEPGIIKKVLIKIQQLEPSGIAAQNIRECLLIQLSSFNTRRPDVKIAKRLLEDHFIDLHNRNLDKIKSHLKIDDEELKIVLHLIAKLKMKPITEPSEPFNTNQNILPDLIINNLFEYIFSIDKPFHAY
jgi:RNA polymerase sigma-54 factor